VRSKNGILEAFLQVNAREQYESAYWTGILDAQGKADGGYYWLSTLLSTRNLPRWTVVPAVAMRVNHFYWAISRRYRGFLFSAFVMAALCWCPRCRCYFPGIFIHPILASLSQVSYDAARVSAGTCRSCFLRIAHRNCSASGGVCLAKFLIWEWLPAGPWGEGGGGVCIDGNSIPALYCAEETSVRALAKAKRKWMTLYIFQRTVPSGWTVVTMQEATYALFGVKSYGRRLLEFLRLTKHL